MPGLNTVQPETAVNSKTFNTQIIKNLISLLPCTLKKLLQCGKIITFLRFGVDHQSPEIIRALVTDIVYQLDFRVVCVTHLMIFILDIKMGVECTDSAEFLCSSTTRRSH